MNKKYTYLIIVFLIVASFAAFGRIAGNDFINCDDDQYITENSNIQSGINAESIKWALTAVVIGNWHPLTVLSHMLDWSLFGANASGHHLVSLLWHIGAAIFLFLFLNKTTNNIWPSAFAAAFFALHPLRVESVAWASERKDVLSMFFAMACLYAYAFYAQKAKISRYFPCLILFALALMSKPMMVTLPFVLMLLDYWPLNRWQRALDGLGRGVHSVGGLIGEKIPFICLTIAACILTFRAQSRFFIFSDPILPLDTRIANAIVSYAAYLGKTFWPFNLAAFYPYEIPLPLWKIAISGFIIAIMTMAVIYYIRKLPFLFAGWFIYLGTLVPVIGLVQVGVQAMADRYTYLPSVGIAFGLAWSMTYLIKSKQRRKQILFPAGIFVLTVLAVLTWRQCGYWKNSINLWNHALNVTKNNALAHYNRGNAYSERADYQLAISDYNESIRLNPHYVYTFYNRGNAYISNGRYELAIADYNEAIRLKPDYADAYNNRGGARSELGLYKPAMEDFNKALTLKPDYAAAFYNRGVAYTKMGRYQPAILDYQASIRLNPDNLNAYKNMGTIYFKQGNSMSGCYYAQKACSQGDCQLLVIAKGNGYCR